MTDVELAIKIPKVYYELVLKKCKDPVLLNAFKKGIVLQKGHKRLIEDDFEVGPVFDEEGNKIGYKYLTQEDLNNAKTVIEADNEENNNE